MMLPTPAARDFEAENQCRIAEPSSVASADRLLTTFTALEAALMALPILSPKTIARFWSHVDMAGSNCWPWKLGRTSNGYGRLTVRNIGWLAHRVAWELTYGDIAEGLCVLHACDNRLCCNPAHMSLGTYRDNNADMRAKDRHARGERVPISKLTADQVRAIRERRASGQKLTDISAVFGIGAPNVSHICHRKGWAHVQ